MLINRLSSWSRLFLVLSTACTAALSGGVSREPDDADSFVDHPTITDRSLITRAEINPAMRSAYDIVQYRRPLWLAGRGAFLRDGITPATPVVYLEGVRYGDATSLRYIEAESVAELRFLSAPDATMLYGMGHTAGAIVVRLRR